MKYSYNKNIDLMVKPQEFDKNSGKEILQYAVGGLLYMPATQDNIVEKIINHKFEFIKSLVLDLEDALGDDLVGFGQRNIVKIVEQLNSAVVSKKINMKDIPLIFIRVRSHGQMKEIYSMLKHNIKYITGFNIPKFDKECCDEYIDEFKYVAGASGNDYGTKVYMMPIIENKTALYRQLRMDNLLYINNALRPINHLVLNIRVGGADFCNIFGIRRNIHHTIYDIGAIRSVLNDIINVFGKSYVVSGPVWEYFGTDAAIEGLKTEIDQDMINGFIGKTCIYPEQVHVVQESLIVDKLDYLDAMGILGMNTNTTGVQKSASGRMNEVKTHSKWAQKIVSLANIYGVRQDS